MEESTKFGLYPARRLITVSVSVLNHIIRDIYIFERRRLSTPQSTPKLHPFMLVPQVSGNIQSCILYSGEGSHSLYFRLYDWTVE